MSKKLDKSLILKEIKLKYNFSSDSEFARFLEIKPQTIASWHTRNTFDIDLIYAKCVNINGNYLLTGKGNILLNDNDPSTTNKIPLYSGVTIGGASAVANTAESEQIEEYIDAGDWFRDATAAMRVHGDSMHPTYKSGSIVALKKVEDKRLILYGQDYVLETSEYRVIKRLQKSDNKEYWRCCSSNEETYEKTGDLIHEPFDVPIDAVSKLFRVLGCVTRTESSRIVLNNTI